MLLRLLSAVTIICLTGCSAGARHHVPCSSRFNLPKPTPQAPRTAAPAQRQSVTNQRHSFSQTAHSWVQVLSNLEPKAAPLSWRKLLQQQNDTSSPPASSSRSSSSSSSSDNGTAPADEEPELISLCPAWYPALAEVNGMLVIGAEVISSSELPVTFTADLNEAGRSGITAADRQTAINAAAAAAVLEATAPASNGTHITNITAAPPQVEYEPGLFEPLRSGETTAVYDFLFRQAALNLTPIEVAVLNDNYVAWMELLPPNKQQAVAWLAQQDELAASNDTAVQPEQQLPKPPRQALVLLLEGRSTPPRVTQVVVGPLPAPTAWSYVPVSGATGQMEASWLQRPYSLPESNAVGTFIDNYVQKLVPVMQTVYEGWYYTTDNACGDKCLTYSLGAPFGNGKAVPAGTSPLAGQRWLWAFFYRNLEGHHLHTVGLEVQVDVTAVDASGWEGGQVWLAGTLWPSVDALLEAWNSTQQDNSSAEAAAVQRLRAFRLPAPNATEALLSTFVPRASSDNSLAETMGMAGSTPPLQYEPGGRRFKLNVANLGLEYWMGWSLAIGHKPTSGVSFWDMRFNGERIIYELSLQEAYAAYGGPSPMQSHTQYLDSHWGMGSAYKELVAGQDCPTNAAFLDLPFSFMSGPVVQANAICAFELSLGQPLLRHWVDAGGAPSYYGAVQSSTLVIRAISTVYNYDYIQDLRLYLDGSMEVAVHTTGYVQSAWFDKEQHGHTYGYPYWWHNSGTIHDHALNWKVDLDVAGTANSIRMDRVMTERRDSDEGFGGSPWYSKRVEHYFPATEQEATLYANGSSKAEPDKPLPTSLYYVVNQNITNRWGSARGYRLQHTLVTPQLLPGPDNFGNSHGMAWTKYQVAVTVRREWEQTGTSPLNQALPYAPVTDFDSLLEVSDQQPTGTAGSSSTPITASQSPGSSKGDAITQEDLVLWVTSGLQHLPGSEDAPVTPTTGPAIGFWLRPFNYFDESAAARQPGMVYIPALTTEQVHAAEAARNFEDFSLRNADIRQTSNSSAGNTTANVTAATAAGASGPLAAGQGRDDIASERITDVDVLTAARRGIQPYVGVAVGRQCLPVLAAPAFNGAYAPLAASSPNVTAPNATNTTNTTESSIRQ